MNSHPHKSLQNKSNERRRKMNLKTEALSFLFCSVCCIVLTTAQSTFDYSLNGDIIIAALLPISKGELCKDENLEGILHAEAVIHSITQHPWRNFSVGYLIKDTCSKPRAAVNAAFELVKTNSSHANRVLQKIVAVIVDSSNTTTQTAIKGILDAYGLPQILIGQQDFKEATVRKELAKVLSELLKEMLKKVDYSSVSMYGSDADGSFATLFKSELRKQRKCILNGAIPHEKGYPSVKLKQSAKHLQSLAQANVGIILSSVEKAVEVLDAARRHSSQNQTWIIITEALSPYYNLMKSHQGESIFVLSKYIRNALPKLKKFRDYLFKLDGKKTKGRPWKIGSQIKNFLPDCSQYVNDSPCMSKRSMESLVGVNQVAEILSKVTSFRSALNKILCTSDSPCKTKTHVNFKRIEDLRTKLKYHFTTKCQVKESCHNTGLADHSQHHHGKYILRKAVHHTSCNNWVFQWVGKWKNKSGWQIDELSRMKILKNKDWKCPTGQPIKLPPYWDNCLQIACLTCSTDNQARTPRGNDSCSLCTAQKCSDIPLVYIKLTHPFALTITCLCVLGEIFVILVVIVFAKYRKTPVVKSSNRTFNFFTLTALGFWFAVIPSFLGRPNYVRCNTIVAAFLILYATATSILLAKTVRLLLIFKSMKKRTKWLGNVSFFLTTMAFILIQVLLCVLNYFLYPLDVQNIFRYDAVLLHCGRSSSPVTALGFAYNCFLSGLCGFFAYKVRKLPQNFNEAKYISFTIFSYSVSWVIVFTGHYNENCSAHQATITSLGLTIGAMSVLGCLFFPKVHTILFNPQRNTKSATLEGARRYSVEAAVSIGGMRSTRPRSSTLDLHYISRSRIDLVLPKVNYQLSVRNGIGRPRTRSDCSSAQLEAEERSRQSSACSMDTRLSRSRTLSMSASNPISPV